jgi:hypothetical protein
MFPVEDVDGLKRQAGRLDLDEPVVFLGSPRQVGDAQDAAMATELEQEGSANPGAPEMDVDKLLELTARHIAGQVSEEEYDGTGFAAHARSRRWNGQGICPADRLTRKWSEHELVCAPAPGELGFRGGYGDSSVRKV